MSFFEHRIQRSRHRVQKIERLRQNAIVDSTAAKIQPGELREQMSPRQIRFFEALAGKTLSACGYPLVNKTPQVNSIDWLINELHIKACHAYSRRFLKKKR